MLLFESTEQKRARRLLAALKKRECAPGRSGRPFVEVSTANIFRLMCESAGLEDSQVRQICIRLIFVSAGALIAATMLQQGIWLMMVPAFLVQQYLWLKRKAYRRAEAFEKDYTALLLSLASAVRTGLDPLLALLQCDSLFRPESEVAQEIARIRENIEQGGVEEEVLRSFASSIDHPDIGLFRAAFVLARKEGASLGECLQRLARVTRQRQSFRRKVKTAVAMQKLSAIGIAACTVVIGLIQWMGNPQAVLSAFHHPAGFRLLMCGLLLVVLGLAWMLSLARARI